MRLTAQDQPEILVRLSPYAPTVLFAFFVWWVFLGLGSYALLERVFDVAIDKGIYLPVSVFLTVLALVVYVLWVVRRLSRCRLELTETELVVLGESSYRFRERRFPLDSVEAVIFGGSLNRLEAVIEFLNEAGVPKVPSAEPAKFFKRGQMTVVTSDGEGMRFQLMDKPFDPAELRTFLEALSQRVPLEVSDLHDFSRDLTTFVRDEPAAGPPPPPPGVVPPPPADEPRELAAPAEPVAPKRPPQDGEIACPACGEVMEEDDEEPLQACFHCGERLVLVDD